MPSAQTGHMFVNMVILLRVACVLMVLSGIVGVSVGGQSAAAGWWLIVVFTVLLLLTFVGGSGALSTDQARPQARRFRPSTVGLVIVAIVVIVPVALLMLFDGA